MKQNCFKGHCLQNISKPLATLTVDKTGPKPLKSIIALVSTILASQIIQTISKPLSNPKKHHWQDQEGLKPLKSLPSKAMDLKQNHWTSEPLNIEPCLKPIDFGMPSPAFQTAQLSVPFQGRILELDGGSTGGMLTGGALETPECLGAWKNRFHMFFHMFSYVFSYAYNMVYIFSNVFYINGMNGH